MAGFMQQTHLHANAPYRSALLTYPSNLQEALRQAKADPKKTLFGVAQGIPSVFLTKLYSSAKPDFIWIDVEHAMFDRLALHDAIHAGHHHSEGRSMVVVRVPKHDEISLTTALDAGASGIVIPHCETAEEVRNFIKEARYPPLGHRSFSPWVFAPGVSDASLYPNDAYNMETANRHVAIIPQIESVKGIENIEEIAAVEGVSALMFGPGDYQADAGIPISLGGEPHPKLAEAMMKFAMAGAKFNLPLLGAAMQLEMVPMLIQQGFGAICVFFDVWDIAGRVAANLKVSREYATNHNAGGSQTKDVVVPESNGHISEEANGHANGSSNGKV